VLYIRLDQSTCTGCQLCVIVCPSECFAMDWTMDKASVIDEAGCIACLNCEDVCPPDCIRIEVDEVPILISTEGSI